mmetsp:Transcript_20352/g.26380  ORF Transcript_20352/g.26380 Transcript_20352/m.26380 type:complete len:308 (-) Transcript_20352:13-936(-)
MDELSSLVSCREILRKNTYRKTKHGPPEELEANGVWSLDSDWRKDEERLTRARELIEKQGKPVSEFWKKEYEQKAAKYWNAFYKRNGDRFFRDRHYVYTVFAKELERLKSGHTIIELGCGVGNGVMPLNKSIPLGVKLRCLDFAPEAIRLLKARPDFDPSRIQAEVCDLTKDCLGPNGSAHLVTCFFVLSALAPETLHHAVQAIASVLHPTQGVCILRDYGRYDEAQLRFSKNHKLSDNFYVKQDGTRCYYFDPAELDHIFFSFGFSNQRSGAYYVNQKHINRATNNVRRRVFVEACYYFSSFRRDD